jgi:hypothetical protein
MAGVLFGKIPGVASANGQSIQRQVLPAGVSYGKSFRGTRCADRQASKTERGAAELRDRAFDGL